MRKAFARRGARERQVRGEARQLASASRRLDLVLMAVAVLIRPPRGGGCHGGHALERPPPVVVVAPLPVPPAAGTAAAGDVPVPQLHRTRESVALAYNPAADRRPALDGPDGDARRAALNRNRGAPAVQVATVEAPAVDERPVEPAPVRSRRRSRRRRAIAGSSATMRSPNARAARSIACSASSVPA